MKKKVLEMEEESKRIKAMQNQIENELGEESKESIDSRSVYVGSVDYGTTPEELQGHFQGCGTINRVTIICDKFSGQPKGFDFYFFLNLKICLR
jgi:polyadenylate-binding protein 2